MIEIEYVTIADSVEVVNGKLYMMGGGWNILNSPTFPMPMRFGIAVAICADPDELEKQPNLHINVSPVSPSPAVPGVMGSIVALDMDAKIQGNRPQGLAVDSKQRVFVAVNGNIPLPQAGKYRVTATLGKETKIVEFEAKIAVPVTIH